MILWIFILWFPAGHRITQIRRAAKLPLRESLSPLLMNSKQEGAARLSEECMSRSSIVAGNDGRPLT